MTHAAWVMPALPLAGFVVLFFVGRRLGDPLAGWVGTAAITGSFVAALVTMAGLLSHPAGPAREINQSIYTWISAGGLHVKASLLIDPLSLTMALFVTGVSAVIHLYSIGYMKKDRDYSKFFVYMNLFVFFMLLLVLGGNLIVTFVGWEGVGLCSYFLISFWFERPSAASAGKKAFIYNRIGDAGFLLAMFIIFEKTGTLSYTGIFSRTGALSGSAGVAAILLLFLAATGKSAQIPLFPWLADAMEGPTPVSALIHAATMVTAGVYLMVRMHPVLALSHDAQLVVASIGVATAFVGGTIACTLHDIKKVVAFSTISQLGYMVLAVGVGAYEAAIFLMVAHAFYKGLLFLGSGSVIHGRHDEQDLMKMGGLAKFMPITTITFVVGWLAIAGVPPLSGFWAKGAVLDSTFVRYPVLWVVGIVTALFTAYYMTRLFVLAFTGNPRFHAAIDTRSGGAHATVEALSGSGSGAGAGEADHGEGRLSGTAAGDISGYDIDVGVAHGGSGGGAPVHESPPVMTIPLVILAVLAFAGGVLDLPWGGPDRWNALSWLGPVFGHYLYNPHLSMAGQWLLGIVDAGVGLAGIAIAWNLWSRAWKRPELEPAFLASYWHFNDIYDTLIGRPGARLASFAYSVVELHWIDGVVNGVGSLMKRTGSGVRRVQTGYVRQYAVGMALGILALLVWVLVRA